MKCSLVTLGAVIGLQCQKCFTLCLLQCWRDFSPQVLGKTHVILRIFYLKYVRINKVFCCSLLIKMQGQVCLFVLRCKWMPKGFFLCSSGSFIILTLSLPSCLESVEHLHNRGRRFVVLLLVLSWSWKKSYTIAFML